MLLTTIALMLILAACDKKTADNKTAVKNAPASISEASGYYAYELTDLSLAPGVDIPFPPTCVSKNNIIFLWHV